MQKTNEMSNINNSKRLPCGNGWQNILAVYSPKRINSDNQHVHMMGREIHEDSLKHP